MKATVTTLPSLKVPEVAQAFGEELLQSAIWSEDGNQCNWLGYRDILDKEIAPYSRRLAALSPEVYSGSAGIAWFLVELYQIGRDVRFLKLAEAAWRRSAKYQLEQGSPAPGISFFAGDLGIAFTGMRIWEVGGMANREIKLLSERLLSQVRPGLDVHHGWDVIGGNAGAIPPLLYLAEHFGTAECLTTARLCADELVSEAQWKGDQCSWSFEKVVGVEMDSPPMSGFSHGATGIAVALLEMYGVTGNEVYRRTAEGAFRFEEELFDPGKGNWVDTRYPYEKKGGGIEGVFKHAWCHGAPGICLGHLRAMELNPRKVDFHAERARLAAETTQQHLTMLLERRGADTTWCHGVAGLSEVLLMYAEKTGDVAARKASEQARSRMALLKYPASGWPSGLVYGGTSPSLMVGYAGTGWHHLRAAYPDQVPSVLLFEMPG